MTCFLAPPSTSHRSPALFLKHTTAGPRARETVQITPMFRLAAVVGAAVLGALLSWVHFGGLWKGVVVSGAGDIGANGYYKWEPRLTKYIKTQVPMGGWRLPSVYDLVSRGPDSKNAIIPEYVFFAMDDKQNQTRVWYLMKSMVVEYRSEGQESLYDNTLPSTGWTAIGRSNITRAALEPPPQVTVSGNKVAPDPHPIGKNTASSLLMTSGMPNGSRTRQEAYPGTALLLVINLAFAYHLWSKRVSPDAVAISYALFWEKREYWRAFTAAFAHYEPLHLGMNALGIWNIRALETLLGTFRYLCLTLTLVVTTGAVKMLISLWLVKRKQVEGQREQLSLGFSCVLFACLTYAAILMDEFCPFGRSEVCFKTWAIPVFGGYLPDLRANFGPFASLVAAQVLSPRAGFIGHLAGIVMGYFVAWGLLERLSPPILACMSVGFMLHHSRGWAHKMPCFSLLLKDWAGGDAFRVARTRAIGLAFAMHACLAVAVLSLFSWGSGLAEVMTLVVGYNAFRALKCCCWSDSQPTEHRFCVNLLKAYGALSAILLLGDLLSFGAILGQARYVEFSGVSECSRNRGLVVLVVAAAVHGAVVAACIEAGVMFRDGQGFLSSIGLKRLAEEYALKTTAAEATATVTSNLSGRSFPGAGRVLGTVAAEKRE